MSRSEFDYTNKDYEAFRTMMIDDLGVKMPEYTDKRQSDAGIVILELLAQGLDILSYYQDSMANEAFLTTEQIRDNALKWCQMLAYYPRASTPSRFKQVFVLSTVQEENVIIPAGTTVKTEETSVEPSIFFETEKDLVIPAGKLGNEQDEENNYIYSVNVVEGSTIPDEFVGTSNGAPNQQFSLYYSPVILDSVQILVNEGNGFDMWERVDNFIDSEPTSRHYTVGIDNNGEAVITFGNGVFGKIPTIYENGIYCYYRIGGGEKGNVGANKITLVENGPAIISKTFNPEEAFEKGFDRETLDEIKIHAPVSYRTKWGALTLDDFAEIVEMNFPKVQFSIAKRDETDVDDLHIYVMLEDNAELTEEIKAEILEMFDENKGGRKIVGADEITIEGPSLVPLTLEATLIVFDGYSRKKVEEQIQDFVKDYFAINNYPFNKELSLSELTTQIMSTENAISGIKVFRFTKPTEDVLTPKINEIYTLESLTISSSGGVE